MKLTPKNWSSFQHYKDRAPTWIKLHKSTLNDFEFSRLPLASKALAPLLWLLASEYEDGQINASADEICFRIHVDRADFDEAIKPLIEKGFFSLDSEPLADCYREASKPIATCLPREREETEERERKNADASASRAESPSEVSSDEADLFRRSKAVLGGNSGGLVKRLIAAKGGSIPLARAAIEQAVTKGDAREYIGAIIRGRGNSPEDLRARGEAW